MKEKETKKDSLFEYIAKQVKEDKLPADFSLPVKEETEGGFRFADGAMDGITMYHMMGSTLAEEDMAEMLALIQLISDGEIEKADEALSAFSAKHRALSVIDDFEDAIRERRGELNAANFYRYGVRLLLKSTEAECVKFGMEILELFTITDERVKDIIRILGLSDEFTLFAVFLMMQWENANEEIFRLAKNVKGWGRIHALEKLKPETDEIRTFFLTEAVNNSVMPDYSALTCFEKADVPALLSKDSSDLSDEEFDGIGTILAAMLTEGPVPGISAVENKEIVLQKYLEHANSRELSDAELKNAEAIRAYLEQDAAETE